MIIEDNKELTEQVYSWINQRMEELSGPRSGGIHLTELIYCLTKSFWKKISPLQNTDKENLTMMLGIGLERVIIPESYRAISKTRDGVDYSPDFWTDPSSREMNELKTTRMSSKKTIERNFPETWIEQIKGYCFCEGKTEYGLAVVHIVGGYNATGFQPEIHSVKFIFEQSELQEYWDYIMYRKDAYIEAFARQVAPIPKKWNRAWECKNCAYQNRCGI